MDAAAIRTLADELVADPGYVTGKLPFPHPVTADEVLAVVDALHDAMEAATELRSGTARELGHPVACRAGCSVCCEQPVMVFLPEAQRVARWLSEPENAAVKDAFLARYDAWRERSGPGIDALSTAYNHDREAYVRAFNEQWGRRAMCAFNAEGKCTIYPVRPLLCRNGHALDTADFCSVESVRGGPRPKRLTVPAVDAFVDRAKACVRAAHHALGGPKLRSTSICVAVHALLTGGA